jgi:CHASE2 domain-containing sensor protein
MLRTTRLVLTTGILTAAWMAISAVAALAGDGVPPLPR